jgi:hypothetical protein
VRSVLSTIWTELKAVGLPLPDDVPSRRFQNVEFIADNDGHANVSLRFEILTTEGKLSGAAHIFQSTRLKVQGDFTGLTLKDQQWRTGSLTIEVERQLPKITSPAAGRLAELRNTIEGRQ